MILMKLMNRDDHSVVPIEPKQETRMLYQIWSGNHRFWCGGKLMTGPSRDLGPNCCAWICLLLIPIIYFYYVSSDLWHTKPAIIVANGFLLLLAIFFMIATTFTDPGIIPRRSIQEISNHMIDELFVEAPGKKYCDTCQIYRPPRASHCRDCDACVMVHDHHCPFVNNCVGKRNYKFFFGFLCSVFWLGASSVIGLLVFTMQNDNEDSVNSDNTGNRLIYLLLIPIGIICLVLMVFLGFHVCLVLMGKTTREQLKNQSSNETTEDIDWFRVSKPLFDPRQEVIVEIH